MDRFDLRSAGNSDWAVTLKSLRLTTLDKDGRPYRYATGFIINHPDGPYLYTCWHVVTGFDFFDVKVKNAPIPRKIVVRGKQYENHGGTMVVGGNSDLEINLYENDLPIWEQDYTNVVAHPDLDTIGIAIPTSLDVVRIKMDLNLEYCRILGCNLDLDVDKNIHVSLWDVVMIVGYPYGYSALGEISVEPIRLHRYISSGLGRTAHDTLLDGVGAKGMSGAPVFSRNSQLMGIYRGAIYPDANVTNDNKPNDRFAALGIITQATMFLDRLTKNPNSVR